MIPLVDDNTGNKKCFDCGRILNVEDNFIHSNLKKARCPECRQNHAAKEKLRRGIIRGVQHRMKKGHIVGD